MTRISIQPPESGAADIEVAKALDVLSAAFVQTSGGGTIGGVLGLIILERDTDMPKALEALAKAGIRASKS